MIGAAAAAAAGSAGSSHHTAPPGPPTYHPPPPRAMAPQSAEGLWRSSFGAVKIELEPGAEEQAQVQVMGVWVYERAGEEVVGFFSGPLRGNVLEFSWHEPASPRDLTGSGFLEFEPDGSSFHGRWWTDLRDRTGDWRGWRPDGRAPAGQYGGQGYGGGPGEGEGDGGEYGDDDDGGEYGDDGPTGPPPAYPGGY